MNSDSNLSIFFTQLKENEYFELRKNLSKIKFIQELTIDFEPSEENFYNWNLKNLKNGMKKMNNMKTKI